MAKHLDLEEQEQLDQLKAFWAQYGNLITWVLIVVFGSVAAYNGYQYWQRKKSADAAVMYDSFEQAVKAGDLPLMERALGDVTAKFSGTTYANQAAMLAAQNWYAKGQTPKAISALQTVIDKPADEGYSALARLRLSALHLDVKAYAEAMKLLDGAAPKDFEALFADRKGDVYAAQNQREQAVSEWKKAYAGLDERLEYRRMVEIKLNSFGVDPTALATAAATAASAAASAASK
jgi:predicted negative regulator of RcsB-dependent stress response